jgi:hypothetical protein
LLLQGRKCRKGSKEQEMLEFLATYGLWILLAGIFIGMHAFGRGCCGDASAPREELDSAPGVEKPKTRAGRCH